MVRSTLNDCGRAAYTLSRRRVILVLFTWEPVERIHASDLERLNPVQTSRAYALLRCKSCCLGHGTMELQSD